MPLTHTSEFLATGGVVTIKLYDLITHVEVSTDSNACTEIGVTGEYKWDKSNLTTIPVEYQEYAYTFTDGSESRSGVASYDDFLIQYITFEKSCLLQDA